MSAHEEHVTVATEKSENSLGLERHRLHLGLPFQDLRHTEAVTEESGSRS